MCSVLLFKGHSCVFPVSKEVRLGKVAIWECLSELMRPCEMGVELFLIFHHFPSTIIYIYDYYCYFCHSGILFLLTATRLYLCVRNKSFSKFDFRVNIIYHRTCKMKPEQNYKGMGSDIILCLQTYIVYR